MQAGKSFFKISIPLKLALLLFIVLNISCATQKPVSAQENSVSMQVFYDQLSPYGEWIDYENYGFVWIPDVDENFEPYKTDGYWVMTDYGWTWSSDYEWGWAPFHYGRWDFDNYYGWFWVPDTEWGPSWVNWRRADGYYGWTPMRPGISISLSFYGGYGDINHWNFVRDRDFGRPDLNRYYVDRDNYTVIIRNSTVINNTYIDNSRHTTYIAGPSRGDVQKYSGRQINNVTIRNTDRPGESRNRNQIELYRPKVQHMNEGRTAPAPVRITDKKDIKTVKERNSGFQQNNPSQGRQQQQPQQRQQEQEKQQQRQQQQEQANPTRQQQQEKANPQQQQPQKSQRQQQRQQRQQIQQQKAVDPKADKKKETRQEETDPSKVKL